jgi:hypothetical protein
MVKPKTGSLKVAVMETGELSLTWTLAAARETLGAVCWAVILDSSPLFSGWADATPGTLASNTRGRSSRIALRAFAIQPPSVSGDMAFPVEPLREGKRPRVMGVDRPE